MMMLATVMRRIMMISNIIKNTQITTNYNRLNFEEGLTEMMNKRKTGHKIDEDLSK